MDVQFIIFLQLNTKLVLSEGNTNQQISLLKKASAKGFDALSFHFL